MLEGDALRDRVLLGGVAPARPSAFTTMSRMNVRSRNRLRISGRPGAPVVMLAHGFGCDQNIGRLVVPGRLAPEDGHARRWRARSDGDQRGITVAHG